MDYLYGTMFLFLALSLILMGRHHMEMMLKLSHLINGQQKDMKELQTHCIELNKVVASLQASQRQSDT